MRVLNAILVIALIVILVFFITGDITFSCDERPAGGDPETSAVKDESTRDYNIKRDKELATNRTPCDTIALKEFILETYSPGNYLVEFDRTFTYNVPKEAVIYHNVNKKKYVFCVIAKSKEGERFVEKKNLIGFESSFINLDSTKLGTAFFFLTLFECIDDELVPIWESEVPIHGGFNSMKLKLWKPKKIPFIELNYEAGIISGHRDYNFFFVNGIDSLPHLMETYEGIVHKRTMANINDDKYPDYYEYRFIEDSLRITIRDSIPFYWSEKRQLYITDVNRRWFRKY
jgi:hypothetical protein